jgi:hypothetical protein
MFDQPILRNWNLIRKKKRFHYMTCSIELIEHSEKSGEHSGAIVSRGASQDQIDNSHYRLILKLGKEMQKNHHS